MFLKTLNSHGVRSTSTRRSFYSLGLLKRRASFGNTRQFSSTRVLSDTYTNTQTEIERVREIESERKKERVLVSLVLRFPHSSLAYLAAHFHDPGPPSSFLLQPDLVRPSTLPRPQSSWAKTIFSGSDERPVSISTLVYNSTRRMNWLARNRWQ